MNYCNGNVDILMTFLSLATQEIVILTTFGADNDEDFTKMITLLFLQMSG